MPNLPAHRNPAHPRKEKGDPRAGEESCTTTLRRSRAGQTDPAEKFSRLLHDPAKIFQNILPKKSPENFLKLFPKKISGPDKITGGTRIRSLTP